jgi:hypothetical protein
LKASAASRQQAAVVGSLRFILAPAQNLPARWPAIRSCIGAGLTGEFDFDSVEYAIDE